MTLQNRNRILLASSILSSIFVLALGILCIIRVLSGSEVRFPSAIRYFDLSDTFLLFKYNTPSVVISICIFGLFVPITMLLILFSFEKTQSQEILYFSVFLIGCLPELFRLVIIVFNLFEGYSQFLFFASRCVFFGRMLSSLSFLLLGIYSGGQQTQDADRNTIIIVAISVLFALFVPINAHSCTSTGLLEYGYPKLLMVIHLIFCVTTFLSLLLNSIRTSSYGSWKTPVYFLLLFLGYLILQYADSMAYTTFGGIIFILGVYLFLGTIHRYYLWK